MSMKLVKKTEEYTIYQRGDERYAVKDTARNAVNGEEKVRILTAQGLLKVAAAAAAEPEVSEEVPAEEAEAEAAPAAEEAPAAEAEAGEEDK